jgi:hypothetical protein
MATSDDDVCVRMPVDARDWLERHAADNGTTLRNYLISLAHKVMPDEVRAERAAKGREIMREWNGYDPTPEEEAELDALLVRRFAEAGVDISARLEAAK